MSADDQMTGGKPEKPTKNFAAIALEHDMLFKVSASLPKFDTSLQMRSSSTVSNSPLRVGEMQQTAQLLQPIEAMFFNGKKRSSRSIDDSAEDILEQSEYLRLH